MRKEAFIFVAFSLILFISSCSATKFLVSYASGDDRKSGKMKDWVYTAKLNSYRVAPLSQDWQRIAIQGGDIAFYNPAKNLVLTVNSLCTHRNYDLQTLSDSLVVGLEKKRVKLRKDIEVGKATGLYTEYETSLENESFNLATVVHKSAKCDYDFSYSASPADFEANLAEFIDFVSGFEELWSR